MSEPSDEPTGPPTSWEAPPVDAPSFDAPPFWLTESELPPPPETGRAVATLWARLGGFGLEALLVPCTFVFGWVGWWIIAWADGQTPAKVLLHQHTVNEHDGGLASFGRMALREALGKGVAGMLVVAGAYFGITAALAAGVLYGVVGAVMAATDPRRRTLWDRIARTVVVEGDPPPVFVPTDLAAPSSAPA